MIWNDQSSSAWMSNILGGGMLDTHDEATTEYFADTAVQVIQSVKLILLIQNAKKKISALSNFFLSNIAISILDFSLLFSLLYK